MAKLLPNRFFWVWMCRALVFRVGTVITVGDF